LKLETLFNSFCKTMQYAERFFVNWWCEKRERASLGLGTDYLPTHFMGPYDGPHSINDHKQLVVSNLKVQQEKVVDRFLSFIFSHKHAAINSRMIRVQKYRLHKMQNLVFSSFDLQFVTLLSVFDSSSFHANYQWKWTFFPI